MKKIFLTGAALMAFAAAGFAQTNTATTKQDGTNQSAVQTQTGNNLRSTITQDRQGSVNVGNFAGTLQTSTGSAGNEAVINQNGTARSNRAFVTQSGGTGNKGVITQSNNSGSGSLAVTGATTAAAVKAAGGNWAGIQQVGSNNLNTYVTQSNTASSNFGEIYQYGSGNRQTSIDQSNISVGNSATIKQGAAGAGITNGRAVISQQGTSRNNEAFITQLASGNDAVVTQNDNSTDNKATVSQTGGSGSLATVVQRDYASNNQAMITQQRGGNTATVTQQRDSYFNKADITQLGQSSKATINQTNFSVDNTASIAQNGYSNTASIDQINASQNTGTGNKATIRQDLGSTAGFDNVAQIRQGELGGPTSTNNVATITQNYSHNAARLLQVGNGNVGTLSQTGDYNVIKGIDGDWATQRGSTNTLTVTQDSGPSAPYVSNVASVSQLGTGNSIAVTQTGRN